MSGGFLALAFKLERVRKIPNRNLDRTVDIALGNDLQILAAAQGVLRVSGQGQGDPGEGDAGVFGIDALIARALDHAGDRPITGGIVIGRLVIRIKLKPAAFKGDAVQRSRVFQLVTELDIQVHLAAGEYADGILLYEIPERSYPDRCHSPLDVRNGVCMLGVSTKFQALHIQRCLIGDLGVLFDNVRGGIGIVIVRRSAIDAVLNGNVIVDQIRGGLCQRRPLSIEDRIFSYSNLFLSLVHALRLLIPASEVIALQRGIICAHRGVPARQVIRRIGDRNICRYTGGPIGVIGQLIDIDLTVQVPDVCAKECFALVTGRAVILFQVHPFADPIEVKVLITVMLHEITACLDLGAQNVLLLWGHGSCRYQLAQRCPTATVSIVCHATFNFDQFVLSVDRLKINIHRGRIRGERPRAGDRHIFVRHNEFLVRLRDLRVGLITLYRPAVERPKAGAAFVRAGHTLLGRVKQCDGRRLRILCGIHRSRNSFRGWRSEHIFYRVGRPLGDVDAEEFCRATLGNRYLINQVAADGNLNF